MRICHSIVIYFFIVEISLNVSGKPAVNYKDISSNVWTIGARKERDEKSSNGYLGHCDVVKFPNAKRGSINVLAFLDSSWPYSHGQAIMLNILKDRLRKSGLTETHFFAVNFDDSQSIEESRNTEDEIEKEAWLGVSPEEIGSLTDDDRSLNSMAKKMARDIEIIQDNVELGIWKSLGGSRDQILVIDRCGKLTYQVIVPWSILHFPYVKAAILSTYKDEPCGACALNDENKKEDDDLQRLSEAISSSPGDIVTLSDESAMTESLVGDSERGLDVEEQTTDQQIRENDGTTTESYPDWSTTQSPLSDPPDRRITNVTEEIIVINDADNPVIVKQEEKSNFHPQSFPHPEETASEDFADFTVMDSSDLTTSINEAIVVKTEEETPTAESQRDFRFREESTSHREKSQSDERNNDNRTMLDPADDFDINDSPEIIADGNATIPNRLSNISIVSNLKFYDSNLENYEKPSGGASDAKSRHYVGDLSVSKMADNSVDSNDKNNDYPHTAVDATTDKIVNGVRRETTDEISNPNESGTDGAAKVITGITNDNDDDDDNAKSNLNLPIRVIMHAPHFHVDRDSTRMHEYIVLETGSSITSHGHLASSDATRLYRGPQDYYENIANPVAADEIARTKWPMDNLIFLNDESTGFFGEVADYWRNNENPDNYEDNDDTRKPEYQSISDEGTVNEKSWPESPKVDDEKNQKTDEIGNDRTFGTSEDTYVPARSTERNFAGSGSRISVTEKITESEESIYREEETRNKLIAHYSKLLPWIYYVLDK